MSPTEHWEQLYLQLQDEEWPLRYIDHRREIARAILFDDSGTFYFMQVRRRDIFGHGSFIETAGGGVEEGETPQQAVLRELREELGARAEILCKLGEVRDFYHLIHRENRNHYFLCRLLGFGRRALTREEKEHFSLTPLALSYDRAVAEYQRCSNEKWGRLLRQRELPMLQQARRLLQEMQPAKTEKTDL